MCKKFEGIYLTKDTLGNWLITGSVQPMLSSLFVREADTYAGIKIYSVGAMV